MLDAVGYVHEQNLVHRDIKPSNFMLDKKGKVKLMDFGIAKNTDANSAEYTQTGTGMQMGTPMYMSPEQITETKSVTAQSDIYSLGVVLWQMVTGLKPYDSNTLSSFQLQMKIVQEPLLGTNTQWDDFIQKATNKESVKRFESCEGIKLDMSRLFLKDDRTIIVNPSPRSPTFVDTLGIEFIWVEGNMNVHHLNYTLSNPVRLKGFYISKYPITQSIWLRVMGRNPSKWNRDTAEHPVDSVSWNDCQAFITKINVLLHCKYSLLTEMEWEYAAKGGIDGIDFDYAGSNSLNDVAWHKDNRVRVGTNPVGKKHPNNLGIYDMTGNVWEWCDSSEQASDNNAKKPLKGGSWQSNAEKCMISFTGMLNTDVADDTLGFRIKFSI
jgi:serine/threonine protein kinase